MLVIWYLDGFVLIRILNSLLGLVLFFLSEVGVEEREEDDFFE